MSDGGRYFDLVLFGFGFGLEKDTYTKFGIVLFSINSKALFRLMITQYQIEINLIFFFERYWYPKKWQDVLSDEEDTPPSSGWIPVSERLPEEGGQYLVLKLGEVSVAFWHYSGYWTCNWPENVSHWRPLPPPPEGVDAEVQE